MLFLLFFTFDNNLSKVVLTAMLPMLPWSNELELAVNMPWRWEWVMFAIEMPSIEVPRTMLMFECPSDKEPVELANFGAGDTGIETA